MNTRALRWLSIAVVAAAGALHAYSYFGDVSRGWLMGAEGCAIGIFAAVMIAGLWAVRGGKLPDAWHDYWRGVIPAAPLSIRLIVLVAWIGGAVAMGRTILTPVSHIVEFHTAWCFGVATMTLCYVLGSRRKRTKNA